MWGDADLSIMPSQLEPEPVKVVVPFDTLGITQKLKTLFES